MKYGKMMFIVSLLFILLLVGCNEEQTIKDDEVIDEPEVEVETDELDNEDSTDDLDESEVDDVIQDDSLEDIEVEDSLVEVKYQINQANWAVEPITDEADSKIVLLTIDDAPDKYALEMATTLKELDVPAIFFVNGHFIQTEEKHEILKEIYQMGFSIGNHTYTHPNLGQISEEEQKQEIIELNDLIEEIIGERPKFFRAPFGVNTDNTKQVVEQEGMVLMNWTYGYDWESAYMEADALADIMVNTEYLRDGANLLMHDREWTSGALADIVTGLRDKGYDFVDPNQIQRPSK